MLILQHISYKHSDRELLFDNIHFTLNNRDKAALIGNNGAGKSTLLKIIAGELLPSIGNVITDTTPYFVPQIFGQFNHLNIAQALRIDNKLNALKDILNGNVTETNLGMLNDDWTVEDRCETALNNWQLSGLDLSQPLSTLSGGQKTKIFLAGITLHQPQLVLLDEPTNHLDATGRQLLYDYIQSTHHTLMVVSHNRTLLNLLNPVFELDPTGIKAYGGNYDFYAYQKKIERNALFKDVKNKQKALRKAKETERETAERKQKLDARGKKKQEKAGLPTISMNTLRNNAEQSTARLKGAHADKINSISMELDELRSMLPETDRMKLSFDYLHLHAGKVLVKATSINFNYDHHSLWEEPLNLLILSGERIALKGTNGSGKTTLLKTVLGELAPHQGTISRKIGHVVYLDQDYSLIRNDLNVYEQAQQFNGTGLQEHEIKTRLNRFLFAKEDWDKSCGTLSGGEKMRLMLCCLNISGKAPDIMILDEPTNNLDMQNIEILTTAVNEYEGTLIVASHDEHFLEQIQITSSIELQFRNSNPEIRKKSEEIKF